MLVILKCFGVGFVVALVAGGTLRALLWLAAVTPGDGAAVAIPVLSCLAGAIAFFGAVDQS